jgi:competence protein ComEC
MGQTDSQIVIEQPSRGSVRSDSEEELRAVESMKLLSLTDWRLWQEVRQTYRKMMSRPPRGQPLVLIALALILGIAIDRRFELLSAGASFLVGAGAFLFAMLLNRWVRGSMKSAILLLIVTALAMSWHHYRWNLFPADEIGLFAQELDRPIVLEATLTSAPRLLPPKPYDPLTGGYTKSDGVADLRFRISVEGMRNGLSWQAASGNLICYVHGDYTELQIGDQVRLIGFIKSIPPVLNPGEFDFKSHARANRELAIFHTDIPNAVRVLKKAEWYWPTTWLPKLRTVGRNLLYHYIPHSEVADEKDAHGEIRDLRLISENSHEEAENQKQSNDQADLAAAVLLGIRETLPQKQTEEFMLTGTIHILSISGLHVGILAWALMQSIRWGLVGFGKGLIGVAVVTTIYTIMTDFEAPAVRAMVLVLVTCFALWLGRPALAWNSLAASVIIVLLLNPCDLFRTGPQLSFVSMGVLMWIASVWESIPRRDPLDRLIARSFTWRERTMRALGSWLLLGVFTSVTIWAVTLPLVMSQYYIVSPSALILNLLLSPLVLIAMVSGFIVLATGWWIPPIASLAGTVCNAMFGIMKIVIHGAADSPGSHFFSSGPSELWLIGFYVGLGCFVAFRYWIPSGKAWITILIFYLAVGWGEAYWKKYSEPGLKCTFISVGHGGAALLELPDGRVILYDCGRLGSPTLGARAIESVLRSRGIRRIDAIIVSHADTDHYNAAPELLSRFQVSQLITSTCMFDHIETSGALKLLFESMQKHGVEHTTVRTGQELFPNDPAIRLKILHPPWGGVSKTNDNSNSVVLEVEHLGKRLLLSGDLEKEGMTTLLKNEPKHYDVLLAPHHGSPNNNPSGMSRWATPNWVISSSGLRDRVDKTEEIYSSDEAKWINLAKSGAVRVRWTPEKLEIRSWRSDPW